jgi:hypothetical protein
VPFVLVRVVGDDLSVSDILGTGFQASDREGCLSVIDALARDFESHGDEWENSTIPTYLDAIRAWLADSDLSVVGPDAWSTLANALRAGRVYE